MSDTYFPKKLVAHGNKIHDAENDDLRYYLAEVGSEEGAREMVKRWNAYKVPRRKREAKGE